MKAIVLFYLPLAVPPVLMAASHLILMTSLARLPDATVLIAAQALAWGVAAIFESALAPASKLVIALVGDRASWRVVRRTALMAGLAISLLALLTAWPPLARPLLRFVFNVPSNLLEPTVAAYGVLFLLVPLGIFRFMGHGMVVRLRRPVFSMLAMAARLPVMLLIGFGMIRWGWVAPMRAGGVLLVAGIALEMILVTLAARTAAASLPAEAVMPAAGGPPGRPPGTLDVLRFLLPLSAAQVMWTVGRPAINTALSASVHAAEALAAVALANLVILMVVGLVVALSQVSAVWGVEAEGRRLVHRFALAIGLLMTAVAAVLGYVPPAQAFLAGLVGLPDGLFTPFIAAFRALILWPLPLAAAECLQGRWLIERRARLIGLARTAGLVVAVGLAHLSFRWVDSAAGLSALAVLVLVAGTVTELFLLALPLVWQPPRGLERPR